MAYYNNQTPLPSNNNQPDVFQQAKENFASNLLDKASETVSKSWFERALCCLDYLKQYFNVNTSDVLKRLLHALIPFNPKFYDISENSPDLYGPFWIYTCLIFIIAASGSLSRRFQGNKVNHFFEAFVSIAVCVIYSTGFLVPLLLYALMRMFGSKSSYVSTLCIYGYSYTIYLPVVLVCAIGFNIAQWILLSYAAFSSTSFILVNYWKEMAKYIDKKRYILIVLIILFQVGLFLCFKLYFFQQFEKEFTSEGAPGAGGNGNNTNTNKTL